MRKSFSGKISRMAQAITVCGIFALAGPAYSSPSGFEREIHLQGTSNTRDIGGYLTDEMSIIRRGQIIRSENLSRLTASDFEKLEAIGVKTVIDLRTEKEHRAGPTVWQGDNPPQFFHFPIGDASDDWYRKQSRLVKKQRFTEESAREHAIEGYRMIAQVGPSSYASMMEVVLDPANWPVVIHCNAGKDRAGVATTLILEALGVDRDTIMEEFLLTNELANTEKKAKFLARQSKQYGSVRKVGRSPSAEAWFPIVGVEAAMLKAFYASVEAEYGSMEDFLAELGVDREDRRQLVAALTTNSPALVMTESP